MKHAYLIIAHQDIFMLRCLLDALDDKRNDIYLHVDKKSKDLYQEISSYSLVYSNFFIYSQIDTMWGDISLVKLELFLFEQASKNNKYSYYHLISGMDYPLKSQDYIHEYCEKHQGDEFIGFQTKNTVGYVYRYKYYWFFLSHYKSRSLLKKCFFRIITNTAFYLQRLGGLKRNMKYKEIKKGCNWVSLTDECVRYIVSQKGSILKNFKYVLAADEFFLHTLVWNSPFKDAIHNLYDEYDSCKREINWELGTPYIWQNEDLMYLIKSNKWYARKVTSNNMDLIKALESKSNEKS